jgi:hypothetical protein
MTTKYYIYSISHSIDNSLGKYIGSTKHLSKRIAAHKFECKMNNSLKLYEIIRNTGGWNAWVVKTLEIVYSDDPEDRRKAEQKWMDAQEIKLNTNKAFCPCKKYYEEHRDDILDYKKVYYLKNRDEIKKRRQEYQKQKRLKQLHDLAVKGIHPKRRSKNDPAENLPHKIEKKITTNNIKNDCECEQIQCEEQAVYG